MALSTLSSGRGIRLESDHSRRDPSAPFRHIDVTLLVCTLRERIAAIIAASASTA